MGTDVQHQHKPHPAAPEPAQVDIAVPAQESPFGLAPPVAGTAYGSVAEAGEQLRRALQESETPAAAPGPAGGLTVGRADDAVEHEADRVASEVVRALRQPGVGRQATEASTEPGTATGNEPGTGSGVAGVRRSPSSSADPLGGTAVAGDVSAVLQRRKGGGSPLPGDVAESMGQSFGRDFSGVRVHTDAEADTVARSLQAKAFTVDKDIYFSKGTFDTSSEPGQHLLAHELTHVAQQDGGDVHRKMWTLEKFKEETAEGMLTGSSDAQKQILTMIADYSKRFEGNGVVSSENASKAIARLKEMQQSAGWWIEQHQTVDATTKSKMDDPSRVKRMKGFRNFQAFLDNEIKDLESVVSKKGDGGVKEGEAIEPSPGFLKLQEKYTGNAKSFLEKMGDLAQKAVSDNGDEAELEAQVKFPIDPSGVGFIGGKFNASVEKDDDLINIRASLSITGGADVDVATVAGELGGYMESQADNGSDCMNLISYAMYRRFRESHCMPNEAANFLWGGQTGKYGFNKAEAWSLALEKKMFEIPDPVLADFTGKYPAAEAKKKFEEAKQKVEERREQIYVETGGLAGASVEGGLGPIASASAGVQGTTGRRVDFTSLENRKGGAGKDNLASDSVLAGFARGVSGGTRGAQKRTGRDVHSFMVTGQISGDVGPASMSASATLQLKWSNDGVSSNRKLNPTGKKSVTSLDEATFEMAGQLGLKLSDLVDNDMGGQLLDHLQGKIEEYVKKKAAPAAEQAKKKDPEGSSEAQEGLDELIELEEMALGVDTLKDNLQEQLASLVAVKGPDGKALGGGDSYRLAMNFDMVEKGVTFELKKVGEKSIELPKSISLSASKASRLFKFSYSKGTWKRG